MECEKREEERDRGLKSRISPKNLHLELGKWRTYKIFDKSKVKVYDSKPAEDIDSFIVSSFAPCYLRIMACYGMAARMASGLSHFLYDGDGRGAPS